MSQFAAAYARYSSDNQRDESIDAQLRAIHEYADKHGIIIVCEYIDRAKSGTNDDRENFQRMLYDSKFQEFSMLLVHKLDRFARNRHQSAIHRNELKQNGVRVVSVLEAFDDSPESDLLEGFLETLNDYYSKNLSREVMKGLKENALACKHTGGWAPLGYKVGADKRLEIDPDEAPYVKFIFKSIAEGWTYSEVIAELNKMGAKTRTGKTFGKNSIYSILRNEKYTGVYMFNQSTSKDIRGKRNSHTKKDAADIIRIEGGVPAIIDKELFNAVQVVLDNRRPLDRTKPFAKEVYLLSGKVYCAKCGNTYCGNRMYKNNKLYVKYKCNTRSNRGSTCCDNKDINRDSLERFVLNLLSEVLFNKERIPAVIEQYNMLVRENSDSGKEEQKAMKRRIKEVERRISNLVAVIEETGSMALTSQLNAKEKEQAMLIQQLNEMERKNEQIEISSEQIERFFKRAKFMLAQGELPKLKHLINLFVERIEISENCVSVKLNMLSGFQVSARKGELAHLNRTYRDALAITGVADRADLTDDSE